MFEAKYGAITGDLFLQALKMRTLLRDSKGDPVINACKTDKDKAAALDGLFQMGAAGGPMRRPPYAADRPPFGRGNGGAHDGRGNGGTGAGGCIGHAKGNCRFPNDCKWEHLSSAKLQKLEKEVVARKEAAVSLVADGKMDSPKGKAQPQGKAAPARAAASNSFAALSGLLTDILNEVAVHDGAAALSGQEDVCGFGMGFHTRMV